MPVGPAFSALAFLVAMVLSTQSSASLQIGLAGVRIVALVLGALAVQQVQIGHGVVVIGTKLQRLLQVLNTVFHLLLRSSP